MSIQGHSVPHDEVGPVREVLFVDGRTSFETRVRFIRNECGCIVDFGVRADKGEKAMGCYPCSHHVSQFSEVITSLVAAGNDKNDNRTTAEILEESIGGLDTDD